MSTLKVEPIVTSNESGGFITTQSHSTLEAVNAAKANASSIVQDAPGSIVTPQVAATPQAAQEAPISQPDANGTPSNAKQLSPQELEMERKEILLRKQARALQDERKAFEQQKAAPKGMTAEEWKAQFLKNPEALGINRQEMADLYLTQPSEERQLVASLEAKIADLEARMGQSTKSIEEAQQQALSNALKQKRAETVNLVNSKPDVYEQVMRQDAHDAVVELIAATYKEDGILMSVEDAASRVEEHLLNRALKLADSKKVREKLFPQQAAAAPAVQQTQATPKTLSQGMQASQPLTPRERAIAAFNRKNQ